MRPRRSLRTPLLAGSGPLSRVNPAAAFLVVAVVFAVGVIVRGPLGAGLLLLLAAGVAVLLVGTWRALAPAHRVGRVLVLALLVVIALSVL